MRVLIRHPHTDEVIRQIAREKLDILSPRVPNQAPGSQRRRASDKLPALACSERGHGAPLQGRNETQDMPSPHDLGPVPDRGGRQMSENPAALTGFVQRVHAAYLDCVTSRCHIW
jgi:hypothetical protein